LFEPLADSRDELGFHLDDVFIDDAQPHLFTRSSRVPALAQIDDIDWSLASHDRANISFAVLVQENDDMGMRGGGDELVDDIRKILLLRSRVQEVLAGEERPYQFRPLVAL